MEASQHARSVGAATIRFAAPGLAAVLLGGTCAAQVVGPTPYLAQTHSPFSFLPGFTVETLEDGLFNTPGVAISTGEVLGPGLSTDSVDADDGVIDGLGRGGHSLFDADGAGGIRVRFDQRALGFWPTHAGLVWTDGVGATFFTAYDREGAVIGTRVGAHADGFSTGQTGEDRFYGVIHSPGISSLRIRNASGHIEIDHVQFAFVPCYADCDATTGQGVLDVFDFLCFQNRFAAGDPYACDCDLSPAPGVCDVFDFLCFQNAYDAGCD